MSRDRFPLLASYVAALPRGLASHPECLVKGSVYRSLVASAPVPIQSEALPDELAAQLVDLPLPNAWSSEVQLNALGLAYQDVVPRQRYEEWVYARNRSLLGAPLYKILFAVLSPERVFLGLAHRWSAFRRGTTLTLVERTGDVARLALTYPRHLHNEHTLENVTIAFRAAADAAGAARSTARVERHDPFEALLEITWS